MTLTRVYSEKHKTNKPTVLIKTCGKDKQCKDKEH